VIGVLWPVMTFPDSNARRAGSARAQRSVGVGRRPTARPRSLPRGHPAIAWARSSPADAEC